MFPLHETTQTYESFVSRYCAIFPFILNYKYIVWLKQDTVTRRISFNLFLLFLFVNDLFSELSENLLVLFCFWIITLQTTYAKPMASLHMTRPVIKGRSQLISDQAHTAYSQVKIYFANYVSCTYSLYVVV